MNTTTLPGKSSRRFYLQLAKGCVGLLAAWATLPFGCSKFNEYVAPPTIIDASQMRTYGSQAPQYAHYNQDANPVSPANAASNPAAYRTNPNAAASSNNPYVTNARPSAIVSPPSNPNWRPAPPTANYAPGPVSPAKPGAEPSYRPVTQHPSVAAVTGPSSALAHPVARPLPEPTPKQQFALKAARSVVPTPYPAAPVGPGPAVSGVSVSPVTPQIAAIPNSATPFPVPNADNRTVGAAVMPPVETPPVRQAMAAPSRIPTLVPLVNQSGPLPVPYQPATLSAIPPSQSPPPPADTLHATLAKLRQTIAANPNDLNAQLALRFLTTTYGLVEAPQSPMPSRQANHTLDELRRLSRSVGQQADLVITNLQICKEQSVSGFGMYEPLDEQDLQRGRGRTVQIYFELQNFASQKNQDGKYFSQVSARIALYKDSDYNNPLVEQPKAQVPDKPSFNHRRDYYLHGPLTFPSLEPGTYELKVDVEDDLAGKIALPARYRFEVKGPS